MTRSFCVIAECVAVCLPEQPDAETDRDVVERVKAHHAHQQILKDDLRGRNRKPACLHTSARHIPFI